MQECTVLLEQTFIFNPGYHLENILDLEGDLREATEGSVLMPTHLYSEGNPWAPVFLKWVSVSVLKWQKMKSMCFTEISLPLFFRKQNVWLFNSDHFRNLSKYLLKEEVKNLKDVAYVFRKNISQLLSLK